MMPVEPLINQWMEIIHEAVSRLGAQPNEPHKSALRAFHLPALVGDWYVSVEWWASNVPNQNLTLYFLRHVDHDMEALSAESALELLCKAPDYLRNLPERKYNP